MACHDRSARPRASMCAAYRHVSTSDGSAPTGRPNTSPSEWAGSAEATSTLRPPTARRAAVAAARVVLPTPPLPVNSSIRTGRLSIVGLVALYPALQLLERDVHDHLFGLAAEETDHRHGQLHGQRVGDPGPVPLGREQVPTLLRLLHLTLDQVPVHGEPVRRPVVRERVDVLERPSVEGELHLAGLAV